MNKLEKVLMVIANCILGFFVSGIMILMLPFYLAIPFALFTCWMWICAPIMLLYAVKKQDEQDLEERE